MRVTNLALMELLSSAQWKKRMNGRFICQIHCTLYGVRKARTKRKLGYRNIPKTQNENVEDDDDEEVDESSDEEKEEDGEQKNESADEEKEEDGEKIFLQQIR